MNLARLALLSAVSLADAILLLRAVPAMAAKIITDLAPPPSDTPRRRLEFIFGETAGGNWQPFVDSLAEDAEWTVIGSTGHPIGRRPRHWLKMTVVPGHATP